MKRLHSLVLAVTVACAAGIIAGAAGDESNFELLDVSSTISSDWKFNGAATADDGRVVFAPYNAGGVGVFDPTNDSFTLVDISTVVSGPYKFNGAATVGDGRVVFAPYLADGVGLLNPRPNNYTSVLKSVYCDGQGPAERMGFDMGCAAYAIPKSYNSETNPAINCFDILDAYPMAPDAPYWFKNSVTHAVERKWCAFGGELGPRMDMG